MTEHMVSMPVSNSVSMIVYRILFLDNEVCTFLLKHIVKHLHFVVTEFWRYWRLRQRELKYKSANIV